MKYTENIIKPEVIPSATGYVHSTAISINSGTMALKKIICDMPAA